MPRIDSRSVLTVLVVLFVTPAVLATPQGGHVPDLEALEAGYRQYIRSEESGAFACGTGFDMLLQEGIEQEAALPGGTPVYYTQDPPVLPPDYRGTLTLENLTVVGNVKKLTFEPSIYDTNKPVKNEKWKRKRTATVEVGGESTQVSIFEPSWNASALDRLFQAKSTGPGRPYLYLGKIAAKVTGRNGGREATERFSVYVRVGVTGVPEVTTRRINDNVHYSANVVNLVVPGYGDSRIAGGSFNIDDTTITQEFYRHFKDVYHEIALVPQAVHMSGDYFAFHRMAQNPVTGIGRDRFDDTADYGSGGTLLGIEWYPNVALASISVNIHEIAHQWGHFLDWGTIAGIARAGHQPSAHTPLIYPNATQIGAVLEGDREVVTIGRAGLEADGYEIGFPEVPLQFHPLTLYGMGRIGAGQIPAMTLFTNQAQFDPDTSTSPGVGTAVAGGTVQVGMNDVIGVHGARTGPKLGKSLRRALVIVSREAPLTQAEWNYWEFLAQRASYDKKDNGVLTYDGYGSFYNTTNNKTKLLGTIEPRDARPLTSAMEKKNPVAFFGHAKTDWRGIEFDSQIPGYVKANKSIKLSGRVTFRDEAYNTVLLKLGRHDPAGTFSRGYRALPPGSTPGHTEIRVREDTVSMYVAVDENGRFNETFKFDTSRAGRWYLATFLFWPDSGSQYPTSVRQPIHAGKKR